MHFDINSFLKFFGSIYKVALILFFSGLLLILSNDSIREIMLLKDFINSYGVYIGIITIISGVVLVFFIIEYALSFIKQSFKVYKAKLEMLKVLKDLSVDEKIVLAYFINKKTPISNLGIDPHYEYFQETKAIKLLIAKMFLEKSYIEGNPYYCLNIAVWEILQYKWKEIFYEKEFHRRSN